MDRSGSYISLVLEMHGPIWLWDCSSGFQPLRNTLLFLELVEFPKLLVCVPNTEGHWRRIQGRMSPTQTEVAPKSVQPESQFWDRFHGLW